MKIETLEQYSERIISCSHTVKCPDCEGGGYVEESVLSSQGNEHWITETCERCGGDGSIDTDGLTVYERKNSVTKKEWQTEILTTLYNMNKWTGKPFLYYVRQVKKDLF